MVKIDTTNRISEIKWLRETVLERYGDNTSGLKECRDFIEHIQARQQEYELRLRGEKIARIIREFKELDYEAQSIVARDINW